MDFHTHHLEAPAGQAIINLPQEWMEQPSLFRPRPGALYSAGIHPWWTIDEQLTATLFNQLPALLAHPQVVALGECGMDLLRGAAPEVQEEWLVRQLLLAEHLHLPVTLHVVRAFDRMLRLHKQLQPTVKWTIHGFRGRPTLARQLLDAGFDLSFGQRRNEESYALTPPDRRHEETDEDYEVV